MRLELRIVEGTLQHDQVIFFWIKPDVEDEGRYVTQPITVNEMGYPATWPGAVGCEDLEEASDILDARDRRFPR